MSRTKSVQSKHIDNAIILEFLEVRFVAQNSRSFNAAEQVPMDQELAVYLGIDRKLALVLLKRVLFLSLVVGRPHSRKDSPPLLTALSSKGKDVLAQAGTFGRIDGLTPEGKSLLSLTSTDDMRIAA